MMSHNHKQWLAGGALLLLAAWLAPPVQAGQGPAEVVYEGAPGGVAPAVSAGLLVASAESSAVQVPDSVPVALVRDDATSGGEKINMIFEKPDKDIITQQALEKLNVLIESLEFANADLQNVIRIIGERLNINFIFDAGDINGKVTLRLHNVRLRDALDSILSSRKLAIVADRSGIFRIVPRERVGGKLVETKTEVIQLNWISALDVQKTLKSFITPEVGKLETNEDSNTIIVTDVPPQMEIVKDLIKQLDKGERQVLIEARLADINIGALRTLGTQWSASRQNRIVGSPDSIPHGGGEALAGQVVPQLLNGLAVKGGQGTLGLGEKIGIFGSSYDFNAVFTALENRNVVEILANPRVTTLNNVPAKISIIERVPYIQASGQSNTGTAVPTVNFEDVGVDIQVKPIITPNGFVRMEIVMKQMIFRGRVGTAALDPPLIDTRQATTNVIVKDVNTVVLGGLRQLRTQEQIDGVPWLHQIPLIGWMFKNKQYDQSKTELVLMMTPRIIGNDIPLNDREKYLYDKIENDWHLPDYFFDDVHSQLDEKARDTVKTPAETKAADAKPAEVKPAEVKPITAKQAEAKAAEAKTVVAKPAGAKPAEVKATVAKPAGAKPAEVKATVAKPALPQSAPTKPAATVPAVPKPAEIKNS